MQIIIYKDSLGKDEVINYFIYKYLINYMYNIIDYHMRYTPNNEEKILELINSEFEINSKEIILKAFENLEVSEDAVFYIIRFSDTKKYDGSSYNSWMNLIVYGSLSVKGYDYILKFFNDIAENINEIYSMWEGY